MSHRKSYSLSPEPRERLPSFTDEGTYRTHSEESEASPTLTGGSRTPGSIGGEGFKYEVGQGNVFQDVQSSGMRRATGHLDGSPLKEPIIQTNSNNACNLESYYFFDNIDTGKCEETVKDRSNFRDIFRKVLNEIRSGKSPKATPTKAARQDDITAGSRLEGGHSKMTGKQEKRRYSSQCGHNFGSESGAIDERTATNELPCAHDIDNKHVGKRDMNISSQMENTEIKSGGKYGCSSNSSEVQSVGQTVMPGNISQGNFGDGHLASTADNSCQVHPDLATDSLENYDSSSGQAKFQLGDSDKSNNNLRVSSKTSIDTDWIFGLFPSDHKQSFQSNNSHNEDVNYSDETTTGQSKRTALAEEFVQDKSNSSCSAINSAKHSACLKESKTTSSAIPIDGEGELGKDSNENDENSGNDCGRKVEQIGIVAIPDVQVSLCEDVDLVGKTESESHEKLDLGDEKQKSGGDLVVDRIQFSQVVWTVMRYLSDTALEKARRTFSVGDDQLMRIRQQQPAGAKSTNSNSNLFDSVKEEDEAAAPPPLPSSPLLPGQPAANQESAFEDVFTPNSLTETQKKARNM
ncbi:uncharacterized protein LOC121428373 [Lytechinus variegatus]|uniref:uncharacterized protein LOC121428373 n=1 Tax=Lytechinus variegatus TaxID=7654 RepID=UPI001BB17D2D|nr:uncharacterized protein LOC121428373 [Lytechinus variegatus]